MTQQAERSSAASDPFWDGTLLSDLPGTVTVETDPCQDGLFLRFTAPKPAARQVFPAGGLPPLTRFTCCHRYEPFWMRPKAGTRAGEVPPETRFLLAAYEGGASAKSVMAHLQTGRLRRDKPLPAFADQFGWCTGDAFYSEVSHDKVREGPKSFRKAVSGETVPRFHSLMRPRRTCCGRKFPSPAQSISCNFRVI